MWAIYSKVRCVNLGLSQGDIVKANLDDQKNDQNFHRGQICHNFHVADNSNRKENNLIKSYFANISCLGMMLGGKHF